MPKITKKTRCHVCHHPICQSTRGYRLVTKAVKPLPWLRNCVFPDFPSLVVKSESVHPRFVNSRKEPNFASDLPWKMWKILVLNQGRSYGRTKWLSTSLLNSILQDFVKQTSSSLCGTCWHDDYQISTVMQRDLTPNPSKSQMPQKSRIPFIPPLFTSPTCKSLANTRQICGLLNLSLKFVCRKKNTPLKRKTWNINKCQLYSRHFFMSSIYHSKHSTLSIKQYSTIIK